MSNYTKSTNFAVKDGLSAGTAAKRVRGTEIDDEYNAIAVAVATKANTNNAALTGVPTAPTAATTTNTTQLATTALVQANVSTKANTNNAALTGVPTAPTASTGTNTTQLATTAFVNTAAAIMPVGSILQVVEVPQTLTNSLEITSSSVMVGSKMNASITPSSTSNKILVQFNVNCQCAPTASAGSVAVTVFRGSGINTSLSGTNLAGSGSQNTTGAFCIHNAGVGTNSSSDNCVSASYIDSPSSTSSVTYTIAFRKVDSSGDARLGGRGAFSTMTLMEIKG
jgi:hypothetical protein